MKLRNKTTGEIIDLDHLSVHYGEKHRPASFWKFSLAELNEEWEDYEEPKEWWYIDIHGPHKVTNNDEYYQQVKAASKEIGNYFETKEEAEKAVEKLKAWKRLIEQGFEFGGWTHTPITKSLTGYNLHIKAYSDKLADYMEDLDLLFGGEE